MKLHFILIILIVTSAIKLAAQIQNGNWVLNSTGWVKESGLTNGLDKTFVPIDNSKTLNNFSDSLIFSIDEVNNSLLYLYDLNSDGIREFVVSCVKTNGAGKIYAYNNNGILLSGFPFQLPHNSDFPARITNYDSDKLILSYCHNSTGYFLSINSAGELVIPEFVVNASFTSLNLEPVVADITGDGLPEIIFLFAQPSIFSSKLVFFDPRNRQIISEFPIPYSQKPPAIGDIDGDGVNEVIHETGVFFDDHVTIWAFKGDGSIVSGWPKIINWSTIFAGVHLANYVGDERPEIVLQLSEYSTTRDEHIKMLSPEGQELFDHSFVTYNWGEVPYTAMGKVGEIPSYNNLPLLIMVRGYKVFVTNIVDSLTESLALDKYPGDLKTFRSIPDSSSQDSELFTVAVQTSNGYSTVNIINVNHQIVQQINISPTQDVQIFDIENNNYLDIIYSNISSNIYSVFISKNFYQYNDDIKEWPLKYHDVGNTNNYNYQGITPVELISFTANFLESRAAVELNWSTTTEKNNSRFEIFRKSEIDNYEWKKIGFVLGFGTTTEPKSYCFIDENVTTGSYKYRLKQIDFDGSYTYYNLASNVEINSVIDFEIEQNYPNPFNPSTTINFSIPQQGMVKLKVFDILGNEVQTLLNEEMEAGYHRVDFNAEKISTGVYIYKLSSGNYAQAKKMVLIK